MSLSCDLALTGELAAPEELSAFQKALPTAWIEEALEATGSASVRRRRLPAEQVVWLVLGIGLYRDRSIRDVCEKLDIALPDPRSSRPSVVSSALAQARGRLGEEPLRYLFLSSAEAWCRQETGDDFLGLKLLSIDGTVLQAPVAMTRVAPQRSNRGRITSESAPAPHSPTVAHTGSHLVYKDQRPPPTGDGNAPTSWPPSARWGRLAVASVGF